MTSEMEDWPSVFRRRSFNWIPSTHHPKRGEKDGTVGGLKNIISKRLWGTGVVAPNRAIALDRYKSYPNQSSSHFLSRVVLCMKSPPLRDPSLDMSRLLIQNWMDGWMDGWNMMEGWH